MLKNNEADLQRSVYRLHKLGRQYYNLKISTNKTKVMAHYGKFPVRSKIIIEDKVLKQTSNFNYLGCDLNFDFGKIKSIDFYTYVELLVDY